MDKLITIINQFANISEQAKNELNNIVSIKEFVKGSYIVEQGKTCRYLYFIKSGFLRGFYYQDGKEITSWFASENDVVTSMHSFIAQKPSFETIEVLEDSTLFEISYNNVQLLFENYPEFNLIGRLLTEKY